MDRISFICFWPIRDVEIAAESFQETVEILDQEAATLDTIGVDPYYQHKGIGEQLINEFVDHLRNVGVQKINTLVDWNDSKLIHFFSANQFSPSKTINLERSL
ncbi:MAG: GNAT family N-acetyltransferase [Desulfobacteraceae bacterium]